MRKLLAAGLLLLCPALASAATRFVATTGNNTGNDCLTQASPCLTIQYAILQAAAGDEVRVAAGTYLDDYAAIGKSLTLSGAQRAVDARNPRPGGETVLTNNFSMGISASNVIVDGFQFGDGSTPTELSVQPSASAVSILNNRFVIGADGYVPLFLGGAGHTVSTNYFQKGSGTFGSGVAIASTIALASTTIANNTFELTGSPLEITGASNSNISFTDNNAAATAPLTLANVNGLFLHRNVFDNSTGLGSVVLSGGNANVSILNNTFTRRYGVYLGATAGANGTVSIVSNTFEQQVDGITIADGSVTASPLIRFNRFANLIGLGVRNLTAAPVAVSAENNWWGCNAGPAVTPATNAGCASISANVDADPWLVLSISATPTTVPANGTSAITGSLRTNSAGADTSAGGFVQNGTPITFAATNGAMSPAATTTTSGQATSSFTPSAIGAATASTTVDNQTVSANLTVTAGTTTTTLVSSQNPSTAGQPVTFTASVTAGATGTVSFFDGAALLATVPLAGNTASFVTSALAVGTHNITATYSGDVSFAGSTSNAVSQVVNPAATATTLVSSQNPSSSGQPVTLTATVTAGATGSVTFFDGASPLGTVPLTGNTASYTTSALAVGTHNITASYGGDATYSGSTSNAVSQVVNAASSTTTLTSSPNPSTPGQTVTFTATVTSGATGNVEFREGATVLGTAAITGGTAAFSTSALTVGTHSITAVYTGSTDFSSSTSNSVAQVVSASASTTTLTSSPNPSTVGQTVTFTATVSAGATGSVEFREGTTVLGSAALSGTTATFTTAALSAGTHPITANYPGDGTFLASSSAPVNQVVQPLTTDLALTGSGGASTAAFTVTNNGPGSATAVTLTATIPAGAALVSATPSQGSCTGTTTVTCSFGTLLSGGSAGVTLQLAGGGNITASVAGAEVDPNMTNNSTNATAAAVTAIPTLSETTLALLAIAMALVAWKLLR